MDNIKIEVGKTYKCVHCGKEAECKKTCYGESYLVRYGNQIWCRDCEMEEFFNRYGTARD